MIAIIKYNAGNTASLQWALKRIGADAIVTDDSHQIFSADKVIFPGVGEASSAMKYLRERKLDELICSLTQPVLGICLGMQLLCRDSAENDTKCLGIFDTQVLKFTPQLKVPHVGWNRVEEQQHNYYAYFVHSYAAPVTDCSLAAATHGQRFSAVVRRGNFWGTQFHPERSGRFGALILRNFLEVTPDA